MCVKADRAAIEPVEQGIKYARKAAGAWGEKREQYLGMAREIANNFNNFPNEQDLPSLAKL